MASKGLLDQEFSIYDPGFHQEQEGHYHPSNRRWYKSRSFVITVLLLPYVLIIILFILYCTIDPSKTNNYYSTELATISGTLTAPQSIPSGVAVSLTSTGAIQAGGGTSIYNNVASMIQTCPDYLDMEPIFSNSFLVSFTEHGTTENSLSIVTLGTQPNSATVEYTATSQNNFYAVRSLDPATGTFVGISQDLSDNDNTAFVMAGQVSPQLDDISFGAAVQYSSSTYSVAPQVAVLSSNSFVITFYDSINNMVVATYGTVAGDLTVSLGEAKSFLDNAASDITMSIVSFNPTTFALTFYAGPMSTGYTGPLQAVMGFVDTSVTPVSLTVGANTTLSGSTIGLTMSVAALDNTSALVAYADVNTGYGVSVALLTLRSLVSGSTTTYQPFFGSTVAVSTGQTLTSTSTKGSMDLDITATGGSGFIVLFSDLGNSGRMTAVTGEVAPSVGLVRTSPNIVLSGANPNIMNYFYWGALAATSAVGGTNGRVLMLNALASYDCASTIQAAFSVYESLPIPVGVNHFVRAGGSVAMGGVVSGFSSLVPGQLYFTNTMGTLLPSRQYYGNGMSEGYFENGNTIALANSQVGLALTSTQLYLKLSAS